MTVYVATLFDDHAEAEPTDNVNHYGPTRLAELAYEHRAGLPTARRIGLE